MKNLSLLCLCLSILSCNPPLVKVNALNAEFLAGLNNKDSTAIMKPIAYNAAVIDESSQYVGTTTIANDWVSRGIKKNSNIKTKSRILQWSGNVAFDGGTYTLDITSLTGEVLKEKGNYSFVWNRQNDGEWKLMLIHMDKAL